MAEKLDRERIKQLLEEADRKWFANHGGKFAYQEHLEFLASYLVANYNRKGKLARQ